MSIKQKIKRGYYFYLYKIRTGTGTTIKSPVRINGVKYMTIGNNVSIGQYGWLNCIDSYYNFQYTPKLEIQDDVHIGNNVCISAINSICIKTGCLISEHFYISDHYHDFDPEGGPIVRQKLVDKGEVVVEENVFIGYRVTILAGVRIGHNCVIGSHAVVTKSFPAYSMIAGIPAKVIKRYDPVKKIWLKLENEEN